MTVLRPGRDRAARSVPRPFGGLARVVVYFAGLVLVGVLATLALLAASCGGDPTGPQNPPDESNDRIDITNDEGTLGERVSDDESDVPIVPGSGSGVAGPASASVVAASATLTLRLRPPSTGRSCRRPPWRSRDRR